jgi:S1-C subfamily serine protease
MRPFFFVGLVSVALLGQIAPSGRACPPVSYVPAAPPACAVPAPAPVVRYTAGIKLTKIIFAPPGPLGAAPGNASSLIAGDVILTVDGVRMNSAEAWKDAVKNGSGKTLRLLVLDAATNTTFITALDLKEAEKFGVEYQAVAVNVVGGPSALKRPTK